MAYIQFFFFFQAEDGIRDYKVTGVQTCALPISGGAFTSLLYGLVLAAAALVRPSWLPFGFVALLWFLLRCRKLPRGWFVALLAFLGFANGLAPWTLRNFQVLQDIVPIVD